MKPLADDSILANDQGSDHWIRACRRLALRRKTKRQGHIMEISYAVRHRFLRLPEGILGAGLARFTDCDAFLVFTLFTRTVTGFLDAAGLASASAIAACAAANRAMATRNGEQLT